MSDECAAVMRHMVGCGRTLLPDHAPSKPPTAHAEYVELLERQRDVALRGSVVFWTNDTEFSRQRSEEAQTLVETHILSVRCNDDDVEGVARVGPRTFVLAGKAVMLHVWNSRRDARRFMAALQRLTQAKFELTIPAPLHVPLASLVMHQGAFVTLVWLPPIVHTEPVALQSRSQAWCCLELIRALLWLPSNASLPVFLGADARLYIVPIGDILFQASAGSKVKPAIPYRAELLTSLSTASDGLSLGATQITRAAEQFAAFLVECFVDGTFSSTAQAVASPLLGAECHGHGLNMAHLGYVLRALATLQGRAADRLAAAVDTVRAEIVVRVLKALALAELERVSVPDYAPPEVVEVERVHAVEHVVSQFLSSADYYEKTIAPAIQAKFGCADPTILSHLAFGRSELRATLAYIVKSFANQLGLAMSASGKTVEGFVTKNITNTRHRCETGHRAIILVTDSASKPSLDAYRVQLKSTSCFAPLDGTSSQWDGFAATAAGIKIGALCVESLPGTLAFGLRDLIYSCAVGASGPTRMARFKESLMGLDRLGHRTKTPKGYQLAQTVRLILVNTLRSSTAMFLDASTLASEAMTMSRMCLGRSGSSTPEAITPPGSPHSLNGSLTGSALDDLGRSAGGGASASAGIRIDAAPLFDGHVNLDIVCRALAETDDLAATGVLMNVAQFACLRYRECLEPVALMWKYRSKATYDLVTSAAALLPEIGSGLRRSTRPAVVAAMVAAACATRPNKELGVTLVASIFREIASSVAEAAAQQQQQKEPLDVTDLGFTSEDLAITCTAVAQVDSCEAPVRMQVHLCHIIATMLRLWRSHPPPQHVVEALQGSSALLRFPDPPLASNPNDDQLQQQQAAAAAKHLDTLAAWITAQGSMHMGAALRRDWLALHPRHDFAALLLVMGRAAEVVDRWRRLKETKRDRLHSDEALRRIGLCWMEQRQRAFVLTPVLEAAARHGILLDEFASSYDLTRRSCQHMELCDRLQLFVQHADAALQLHVWEPERRGFASIMSAHETAWAECVRAAAAQHDTVAELDAAHTAGRCQMEQREEAERFELVVHHHERPTMARRALAEWCEAVAEDALHFAASTKANAFTIDAAVMLRAMETDHRTALELEEENSRLQALDTVIATLALAQEEERQRRIAELETAAAASASARAAGSSPTDGGQLTTEDSRYLMPYYQQHSSGGSSDSSFARPPTRPSTAEGPQRSPSMAPVAPQDDGTGVAEVPPHISITNERGEPLAQSISFGEPGAEPAASSHRQRDMQDEGRRPPQSTTEQPVVKEEPPKSDAPPPQPINNPPPREPQAPQPLPTAKSGEAAPTATSPSQTAPQPASTSEKARAAPDQSSQPPPPPPPQEAPQPKAALRAEDASPPQPRQQEPAPQQASTAAPPPQPTSASVPQSAKPAETTQNTAAVPQQPQSAASQPSPIAVQQQAPPPPKPLPRYQPPPRELYDTNVAAASSSATSFSRGFDDHPSASALHRALDLLMVKEQLARASLESDDKLHRALLSRTEAAAVTAVYLALREIEAMDLEAQEARKVHHIATTPRGSRNAVRESPARHLSPDRERQPQQSVTRSDSVVGGGGGGGMFLTQSGDDDYYARQQHQRAEAQQHQRSTRRDAPPANSTSSPDPYYPSASFSEPSPFQEPQQLQRKTSEPPQLPVRASKPSAQTLVADPVMSLADEIRSLWVASRRSAILDVQQRRQRQLEPLTASSKGASKDGFMSSQTPEPSPRHPRVAAHGVPRSVSLVPRPTPHLPALKQTDVAPLMSPALQAKEIDALWRTTAVSSNKAKPKGGTKPAPRGLEPIAPARRSKKGP